MVRKSKTLKRWMQGLRGFAHSIKSRLPLASRRAGERRIAQLKAELAALEAHQQETNEGHRQIIERQQQTILWLAQQSQRRRMIDEAGPLVSVVMPTWNRAWCIGTAIESLQAQSYGRWELLVADDGSTDGTAQLVAQLAESDARIRYLPAGHIGQAAARNRALAASQGEIIAYLDTDNTWYPGYLEDAVAAFARQPEAQTLYGAQVVVDAARGQVFVRDEPFDRARLEDDNFIDMNVFAHRRSAWERWGGFDERLTCVVDWDLILRYTQDQAPIQAGCLAGRYEAGTHQRVTNTEARAYNVHAVRRQWQRPITRPLRVLYVTWHYPQMSESYVRWEIAYMRRRGVEVCVWSQLDSTPAPFPMEEQLCHGDLASAVQQFKPDVAQVHWSSMGELNRGVLETAGVPMTIRDHSFDFTPERMHLLSESSAVEKVYLFPHLHRTLPAPSTKFRSLPVGFNAVDYAPQAPKDRRLVVRVGAALPTKDLKLFLEAAKRCPEHRFVLALAVCVNHEAFADEIQACNRAMGSPAEIRMNVQHHEILPLMQQAGIYLHTHGLMATYGMPISIAEAMGTGAYIVGRKCPASEEYIGDAGVVYDTVDEAVEQIQATTRWTDADWQRAQARSVERAFDQFADQKVWGQMLSDWLEIVARRADNRGRLAA